MEVMFDSPIPINDRILNAYPPAMVGRASICAASPQIPDEPSSYAHCVSQRLFHLAASVALYAFNGTAQGFRGNLDNMSSLHMRCLANWTLHDELQELGMHCFSCSFQLRDTTTSRPTVQGCDLQQGLTTLI